MEPEEAKRQIVTAAVTVAFGAAGAAPAPLPPEEGERLGRWLAEGKQGTMSWMERSLPARLDPEELLPGARTVLVASLNYYTPPRPLDGGGRISIYALGRDYHNVFRSLLRRWMSAVSSILPGVRGRWFVDSAPILEKYYAERAGLGWRGKHTNLIHPERGSWFFLGGILIDRELPPDRPLPDRCGSCTACIDACPTGAIVAPYTLDGSRCISYLTIEHRGEIDRELADRSGDWIFGCDICQQVCPWNGDARETERSDFRPRPAVTSLTLDEASSLGPERFDSLFEGSPVRRAGWERFGASARRALRNRERGEHRR